MKHTSINKFIKATITSALLFCGTLTILSTPVHAGVLPGSACNPATLGQALNLGFTTNQFGVSNPSSSSTAFFVVCPLAFEFISGGPAFGRVIVGMEYTAATGGTTNCTVRLAHATNSPLNAVPLVVSRGSAGYAQTTVNVTHAPGPQTNATIVCPVRPGETLIWFSLIT